MIDEKGLLEELYYSDNAVNMSGEYHGLWVHFSAIEKACENNRIDAVKVIRCKDCKHFVECLEEYTGFCDHHESFGYCADDYCSDAVKKESDNDTCTL